MSAADEKHDEVTSSATIAASHISPTLRSSLDLLSLSQRQTAASIVLTNDDKKKIASLYHTGLQRRDKESPSDPVIFVEKNKIILVCTFCKDHLSVRNDKGSFKLQRVMEHIEK
jgi:hypothetical protein